MHDNIKKSLKIAIALTSIIFVVEILGGLVSGSLSLLGDAGHMFRDVFALFISLSAINIARKLPTKTKTFGYHRVEIFAAFINGILLIGISIWILWEAYQRFFVPRPIESPIMFIVAVIGLLVNMYIALKLHGSHNLNVKSAYMHVLTDMLSSVAVIFAAVWIFFTGQHVIDPVLGVAISVFILFSAIPIIRDSVRMLLEFTPKNVNIDDVVRDMKKVRGVQGVHSVHLWALSSDMNVIDVHIFTKEPDMGKIERMKMEIKARLKKYDVKYATLEFECEECITKARIGGR